jgi:hypothetical protein
MLVVEGNRAPPRETDLRLAAEGGAKNSAADATIGFHLDLNPTIGHSGL